MNTKMISRHANPKVTLGSRVRLRKRRESITSSAKEQRLAALERQAFFWIERGREANLKAGRIFCEMKAIVGHGRWQHYFRETFGPRHIALRTAEVWMRTARDEDARNKTADSANFPPARDQLAVKVREATAKAKAEEDRSQKEKVRAGGIFKLPLLLTVDEQEATRELLNSPDWLKAQREIVTFLNQLHVKFGIVAGEAR
jgi:hypothetical protein